MDVGIMFPPQAPRFFRKELEKTPSPEKEEAASLVEQLDSANPGPRFNGREVDFTYLDDAFAEDVVAIEERKPRPGDKAAADLPELAVAEDGTVFELVDQEYIRALLKSPPRTHPLPDCSVEALRAKGIKDEGWIEIFARSCQNLQRGRDIQNDIIDQYLDKGYAYLALPVSSKRYPATAVELPPLP